MLRTMAGVGGVRKSMTQSPTAAESQFAMDNIVLMAYWRYVESVKMQIGRARVHRTAGAVVRCNRVFIGRRRGSGRIRYVVLEPQDDGVAGAYP